MPSNLPKQIATSVAKFGERVKERLDGWAAAVSPTAFRAMELEVAAQTRELADAISAHVLRAIANEPRTQAVASRCARRHGARARRHGGRRRTRVTLLHGTQVELTLEYLKPNRRAARTKRANGNRGAGGGGLYPVLAMLGIGSGVTPALAGEVCYQVADSDSVRTGRAALARRGIALGHQRTLRIVNQTSRRAVAQRQAWLDQTRDAPARPGPLADRRVLVAVDGGRLRERQPTRCGRPRKSGHRSYATPWREPKQIVIYTLNDHGKVADSFAPVYDATLGDCDAVFDMLHGYLAALGAHEAAELIVVGDGAPWIWNRAAALGKALGLAEDQLVEVIDWFHAVETLHTIAKVPRGSNDDRDRWLTRATRALAAGDIDRVLALIRDIAVGRRARLINEHRDYFARNRDRMQYALFADANVPRGSGAVESAIRRVVNQRLKGAGTFWLEHNAEGMLLLRSYLKCRRFDDLIDWSLSTAASWWPVAACSRDLSRGPLLHVSPTRR